MGLTVVGVLRLSGTAFVPSHAPIRKRLLVHDDGISYHFASNHHELNELNYGLGASYCLGEFRSESAILNGIRLSAEADLYSDSFSETGYLFGTSFERHMFKELDWGVGLGLIHEDNLKRKSGFYLFPYVFPYLQTAFRTRVNVRIQFVPPVHNGGIVTLQLIVAP